VNPWLNIVVIVGLQGIVAAVSYGVLRGSLSAQVAALKENLNRVESNVATFVTRTEYESRHRDLKENLTRIESKLDRLNK
jgi:hypothetical protein